MTRRFFIENKALDVEALKSFLFGTKGRDGSPSHPGAPYAPEVRPYLNNLSAGALVTFEGRVRNQNEGKEVRALEYEAYLPLAEKEGEKILEEALAKFDILDVLCVHRMGKLTLGEIAVWVGVLARHRREAFQACETIIGEVKHRVPIWKKEHYASGQAQWVNCAGCAHS